MNEEVYLGLAHIAGEVWGTIARAHMAVPLPPELEKVRKILGHDIYFEILGKLKEDFKKEVTTDETETPDGEDA